MPPLKKVGEENEEVMRRVVCLSVFCFLGVAHLFASEPSSMSQFAEDVGYVGGEIGSLICELRAGFHELRLLAWEAGRLSQKNPECKPLFEGMVEVAHNMSKLKTLTHEIAEYKKRVEQTVKDSNASIVSSLRDLEDAIKHQPISEAE